MVPDEASILGVLNNYARSLGDEDVIDHKMPAERAAAARASLDRAKQAGACDYFKDNPDVVRAIRREVELDYERMPRR